MGDTDQVLHIVLEFLSDLGSGIPEGTSQTVVAQELRLWLGGPSKSSAQEMRSFPKLPGILINN